MKTSLSMNERITIYEYFGLKFRKVEKELSYESIFESIDLDTMIEEICGMSTQN